MPQIVCSDLKAHQAPEFFGSHIYLEQDNAISIRKLLMLQCAV